MADAGAGRIRFGIVRRPVGEQAGDAEGVGAVIGAFELENLGPPGEGAGEPLAIHRRLGARGTEPERIAGGAEAENLLRQHKRVFRDVGEIGAEPRLARHRLDDFRPGMANEHRAPAHGEVNEFSALGVPQAAALAMVDDHGQLLGQVELAVGTGGKGGERALPHRCHGRCSSSNFDPMAPGPPFPGADCLGQGLVRRAPEQCGAKAGDANLYSTGPDQRNLSPPGP